MKILITTDTLGGVWTYSMELCRALSPFGVQVHLTALGALPSEAQEQEVTALENVAFYKSNFKLEWMQDPWEDIEKTSKWLNNIYQTIQPDLVHFNNYAAVGARWNTPKITVFHSCVETWWRAVKKCSAPADWNIYKDLVKNSLESSDLIVAPTKAILEKAKQTYKITSATKVIYNGIKMNSSEEKEKENFIFCTGRIWDEAKNLGILSEIAENLPWPVYIAGDNANPNSEEEKEIRNIHFLGKLTSEGVKKWMKRAAIFVSPTKYEPFGLAILEAAHAGCALVLSNLETLQEIWGENALYFNPKNADEIEEKLLQLIQNKEKRMQFSQRAKLRAGDFSAEKMGKVYFHLYRETIAKEYQRNKKYATNSRIKVRPNRFESVRSKQQNTQQNKASNKNIIREFGAKET